MPLEEITQKAGEDIDSPLNPLESIENSNQSRNYLGKAYDYAKTTSDKVASSAKRFWDYKGKKWAVDTLAMAPLLTLYAFTNEVGIQHFDVFKSLRARATNCILYPLIGPVMEVKDAYRKYVWGINDESNPPYIRNKLANLSFSTLMQLIFYVPSLIAAGERDPKRIGWAVATNMGLRVATNTLVTFPVMDKVRKYFGTTPKRREKTKPVLFENSFDAELSRELQYAGELSDYL